MALDFYFEAVIQFFYYLRFIKRLKQIEPEVWVYIMSKLARYSLSQNDFNELFLEEKLSHSNFGKTFSYMRCYSRFSQSEAAVQRYSEKKVFWKYAANLQENTHAEVRFQ